MLAGCRVLVVENEALVAEAISEVLIEAEGAPVGLARSACEARQLIKNSLSLDAALLDGNLSEGPVIPVLEALNAPGVPTGVYTGGAVSENFRHRNVDLITLAKPVLPAGLIGEIRNGIAGSHPHPSAE